MDRNKIQDLLEAVANGTITASDAVKHLENLPYTDIDFAKIDSHRALRQGSPEVIFCPGKTAEQIVKIAQTLKANHALIIASRCSPEVADTVISFTSDAHYDPIARMIVWGDLPVVDDHLQPVAILAAGTADLPVAEEAALFLAACGIHTTKLYDVGVAGLHRLLLNLDVIQEASVVIVIAGMDGALPSVVGGLIKAPVIAVPTSIGYGASFEGLAALLTMLNSCAAGITVVNIDNGFGAAFAALRIMNSLRLANKEQVLEESR